jgi:hypothetical protein
VSSCNLTFTSSSPTTPTADGSTILVDDLVVGFDEGGSFRDVRRERRIAGRLG